MLARAPSFFPLMPRFSFSRILSALLPAGVMLVGAATAHAQAPRPVPAYELPPINYSKATASDAVARLQQRFDRGELTLEGTGRDLLLRVLKELQVPVESQALVFTKTSLQKDLISPATPRAVYFSESIYVGWIPGGAIEVAALDPVLGPVFYTLDASERRKTAGGFRRDNSCLLCHGYFYMRDVPALFAVTTFPDLTGNPLPYAEQDLVDDVMPFSRRWGGWYVTGYTGEEPHRGNAFGTGTTKQNIKFTPNTQRPAELSGFFDTSRYPAATSEALTLLVFEHQMAMQTTLVRASQLALRTELYSVTSILDRLLFRRAALLPEGIVRSEGFLKTFMSDAKRSRAGDSLKDIALDGRLFRNRCSYLIYSETFTALPAKLKHDVLDRLYAVLHDDSPSSRYAYLPKEERQRIYQILLETHPAARERFEILASASN